MKRYKIREKSLAWYVRKTWLQVMWCIRKHGKAIIAAAVVIGALAVYFAPAVVNEPTQANTQEPTETCSVVDYEAFTPIEDAPLPVELQAFIFGLAEDYGLDGHLVMAVIGQESNYKHCVIGDDGEAYGLMQIHPAQHEDRMARLKITKDELLDPYANVVVGVDYLAECIEEGGLEWGLMAYNGGFKYANEMTKQGVISEYAESVMMLTELLKGENNVPDSR